jgi:hypothetical protein
VAAFPVLLSMLYFRVLGRLAWYLSEGDDAKQSTKS